MSNSKLSKSSALLKTIEHTREEALSRLSDQDKDIYEKVLTGDRQAIKQLSRQTLGSPLYEAGNYILVDHLELVAAMEDLGDVSNPNALSYVKSLLDVWVQRYGVQRGVYLEDIVKQIGTHGDQSLLILFLDRGILTASSTFDIPYRDPTKTYLTKDLVDYKKKPAVDSLIAADSSDILLAILNHAEGRKMYLAASYEEQYHALRFSFDTRNQVLLGGLLNTGLDISKFRDPNSMDPLLVDFLYRTETDEDVSMLRYLCLNGIEMDVRDRLQSTPLVVASRIGNVQAFKFLCEFDLYDVYSKNSLGEDLLSITQAAPKKRLDDQVRYDEALARARESFVEKHKEWEAQTAIAEAAGKKPLPEPKSPKFKPRPVDYPVELVSLVQELWSRGDPSKGRQSVVLSELHKPDEFSMSFDSAF